MKIPEWLPDTYRPWRPTPLRREPLIQQLVQPVARFLHVEAASGIVLLVCTVVALVVANSAWREPFIEFWQTPCGFQIGNFALQKPLVLWINDGLMTIFFFVVGLEIKREFLFGELRDPRKAALPAAAALGGMIVPAGLYLALLWGEPGERGWGVPMATDIAFVVGFLALLGRRVPFGLKILLLTLAIVDDIGAIVVIAVAYSDNLALSYLGLAVIMLIVVRIVRSLDVLEIPIYYALGAVAWYAFLKSGVHPTVAGVILGLMTPAYPWFAPPSLLIVGEGVVHRLRQDATEYPIEHHEEAVQLLTNTARETISPLDRLETALHPWVAFIIMPLFALANAGVGIDPSAVVHPVTIAVTVGLFVGKPIGVVLFSWVAVQLGIAKLPNNVNWKVLTGAGCLAGIGFTMSLFIANLGLEGELLQAGKIGTLIGSVSSAIVGMILLLAFTSQPQEPVQNASTTRH